VEGAVTTRPEPGSGPAAGALQSTDGPSDADLAAWAVQDPEAFGQLYDRHCDRIYRYVLRRIADVPAAEDVTAEVFFKALRALAGYRPETAPFSAWLYGIAGNAVIDHLRRTRITSPLEAAAELADPAPSVEDQAVSRVEADRVWAAVDGLTEVQRQAVVLRLGHDLPIAEIAARLGRSEGAVKLLLNRGLAAVRKQLDRPADPTAGSGPGNREEAT
jgi:RNA polymerase sigma-70 factor, ECF subfamily